MKISKSSKQTFKNKDFQEFQQLWEKSQKELAKKAKTTQEKLFADFLTNNYLDSKTGLITNKQYKENSSFAC
jgi:hypothetical protein